MQENWRNYANAPEQGAIICSTELVKESEAHCFTIKSQKGDFPVIIVRRDSVIHAYVNACPHQYLPLNYRSETIISSDRQQLLCSVHGAAFDSASGHCTSGALDSLDPVPVFENSEGNLCIGG